MRIKSIKLKNFKRFSDLEITGIPETTKLVVLVGPNGCGKSSLFDALLHWYKSRLGFGIVGDELYFRKNKEESFEWSDAVEVTLVNNEQPRKGCLYVRTAYRNDADFSISGISRLGSPADSVRLGRLIENDQTVGENYQRLIYDTMAGVYDEKNDKKSVGTLREELIGAVRRSMKNVFGDLLLNSVSDPLGDGAFFFEKGISKSYHYKNLSGGEKAAFDLLLDLHVKKKFYNDAIYCVDELETHLHTRVQGALIKEMISILPENSQLWATTHSLGVLRAAQEMAVQEPGTVCVIDFDGVDPDVPRQVLPGNLGRISWEKMLSLALDDLSVRVAPKFVVVCEGSSIGSRRQNFDAEIYNRILGSHSPDTLFVSGGASSQVAATGVSVQDALRRIIPSASVIALCDLDDKSVQEVAEFEESGNIVLPKRNLESYLFADDVIEVLVGQVEGDDLLQKALEIKRIALENCVQRGKPGDDLKSASGEIYTKLKQLLRLIRVGNSPDAFMRDTLAPLIRPGMKTYDDLHDAIVKRVIERR